VSHLRREPVVASALALVAALAASAFAPGPAAAVPTVRGATGLIAVPTTAVAQSTSVIGRSGRVITSATKGFTFFEVGLTNRDGATFYDAKVQALPDVTTPDVWIPSVALGIRGISSRNQDREFYVAMSKRFTYPVSVVTLGLSKAVSWEHGPRRWSFGFELPVGSAFSLLADHDGHRDETSVGARLVFGKHFCVYDYVQDVRRTRTRPPRKLNLIGVCYQNQF
jgi:hypothetical protein